ncbi:hypothetical protein PYCCODRAFT_1443501 [Trametes coccinea BRFM310]|uniref:Uncharacterized protein n=1 Tax=Trametes coccinea (strain BRFM310) TaxID=1353009 RepID=A0A1Y2IVM0_TRAC3|nr:hypothetical protein PYCCODRAFT_1443501 [Trametes coccinea BRFM310]
MHLETVVEAPYAARYVNAQLTCLHENATRFLEESPLALREENKFTIPSVSKSSPQCDSLFQARFSAPKLDFICNHDALLTLTFEHGEFLSEGHRVRINAGAKVGFRVMFETREAGSNLCIDGYIPMIKVVILDLDSARLDSITPTDGQNALLGYLREYLSLLHAAGNDVLYLLPQFSAELKIGINFALVDGFSKNCVWQKSICGITAEQCNSHLASLWLNAAMLLRSGVPARVTDRQLYSLAELVVEDIELSYRLRFGTPRVHILCTQEVVLCFDIDELEFVRGPSISGASARKYTDWKVAFLVDVLQERDSEGNLVQIILNYANARYVRGLSEYRGVQVTTTSDIHHRDLIIEFLSTKYFDILRSAGYHTLYSRDSRSNVIWKIVQDYTERVAETLDVATSGSPDDASSHDTIHHAKMYGFDQVVAISQRSLNVQLSMLSHALLQSWAYGDAFSASFKPLSVRLLSDNRAIVWINLLNGKLKTLRDGKPRNDAPSHEFKNWLVAFEVDLKLCTQAELERHYSSACHESAAYKRHGNKADRHLQHICLDFSTARYIHDHSSYQDLTTSSSEDGRSMLMKVEAIVCIERETQQQYLPAISKHGLNVLLSVPVFKPGPFLPSYALTSIAFQVYSRDEVTRFNWMEVTAGMEPIVVILGMTGSQPLPPTPRLQYSTNWIARKGFSHGTICISYAAFRERVLSLLAKVNAQTSFIPIVNNESADFFGSMVLRAWENSDRHKNLPATFQPPDANHKAYHFEHTEKRVMSFGGDAEIDADQKIFCTTENFAELPTTLEQGDLTIRVHGSTRLAFSVTAESADQLRDFKEIFRASSSENWSNKITVETIEGGVKINIADSSDPKVSESKMVGSKLGDPKELLAKAFPPKIDFGDLLAEIRAFEGAWDYCCPPAAPYSLARPTFNADGDLVFELRAQYPGSRAGARREGSPKSSSSHRGS